MNNSYELDASYVCCFYFNVTLKKKKKIYDLSYVTPKKEISHCCSKLPVIKPDHPSPSLLIGCSFCIPRKPQVIIFTQTQRSGQKFACLEVALFSKELVLLKQDGKVEPRAILETMTFQQALKRWLGNTCTRAGDQMRVTVALTERTRNEVAIKSRHSGHWLQRNSSI